MTDEWVYLNGLNALTGGYLVPPLPVPAAADLARANPLGRGLTDWFRRLRAAWERPFLALPFDVDPVDVTHSGWAVVFARDTPGELRAALEPLLAHRRARVPPDRCKVLEYQPGQTREAWLGNHKVSGSNVVPQRVPYYLLLVGGLQDIPFEFQSLLAIDYAVGRLALATPEQFRRYAESVVEYETARSAPHGREVAFWGTRHDNDPATALSCDYLITPLREGLPATPGQSALPPFTERFHYRTRCFKGDDATRANLAEVLHGRGLAPPAVLFTASHGLGGWPAGDVRQRPGQGGLVCQDWPGFGHPVAPGQCLTAADLADDARVHGLVAFLFASYGAGSPAFDRFLADPRSGPVAVADEPYVAALPQRLLSHPQGAALAVVGHVDRAWGYSFRPPSVGERLMPFRNFLGRVLAGQPVGHAIKDFSQRYATQSVELLNKLDDARMGPRPTDQELVWAWIERNDAQGYALLGDPAVRLRNDLQT